MLRILAILALILSAARGVGLGVPVQDPAGHGCMDGACHVTVVETTCCGMDYEKTYCQTSGGECRCGARPVDDAPRPAPMPYPGGQGDLFNAIRSAPVLVRFLPETSLATGTPATLIAQPRARYTHNGFRAFLSIWRT